MHLGVAGDDALLHVEALALVGLLHGGDAGVAVEWPVRGRGGGSCRTHGTLVRGRRLQVTGEAIAGGRLGMCWRPRKRVIVRLRLHGATCSVNDF